MGKLNGGILGKVSGSVGNVTGRTTKNGNVIAQKRGPNTGPTAPRTSENNAEFARAASLAKSIRVAARSAGVWASSYGNTLTRLVKKSINADTVNERGARMPQYETLATDMAGQKVSGDSAAWTGISATVTADGDSRELAFGGSLNDLPAPTGATGVRATLVSVDTTANGKVLSVSDSAENAIDGDADALNLTLTAEADSTADGIHAAYIILEYTQEVNGTVYPLVSGKYTFCAYAEGVTPS